MDFKKILVKKKDKGGFLFNPFFIKLASIKFGTPIQNMNTFYLGFFFNWMHTK